MSKTNTIDDLLKSGLIKKGDDPSLDIKLTPFGIAKIDEIIGGGLPHGRNTLFVGDYSSGKTFLLQQAIRAVQKQGGSAAYVDAERSYDRKWFEASGIDTESLIVSQPEYGERAVDAVIALLESKVDIVGLDSIAALIPSVEEEESAEKNTIGLHARLVSKAYRKATVANTSSIFIGINQLRQEIGPYGKETYPGGQYHKYASHLTLKIRREQWIKEKVDGHEKKVGFDMSIEVVKNKVGTPWGQCSLPFYFNGEIDELVTNLDMALSNGVIIQKGPYYYWHDAKWMGKQAMRVFFNEHPEDYQALIKEL